MAGEVQVSVTVPASSAPAGGSPITRLPFTGFDVGGTLVAAAVLIALGTLLLRLGHFGRRPHERGTAMRRRTLTSMALTGVLSVGMATIASAAEYEVTVTSPPGSRTIYVEDLTGQPLTSLDFGNARSMPFRIRVVDTDMSRSGFDVQSSMSNLYLSEGDGYSWDDKIPSGNVNLGFSNTPLNLANPTALVQPVLDLAIPGALCSTLTLLGGDGCSLPDVMGILQQVPLPTDLADLTNLPLLPQAGQAGAYAQPNFAGIAAAAPGKAGAPAETVLNVLSATATNTLPVLGDLQDGLLGIISPGGLKLPAGELVDPDVLTGLLQNLLGPVFDLLGTTIPLAGALPSVENLIGQLTWTLDGLVGGSILRQSGTYTAYPVLNVDVPNDVPGGSYKGTMVLTFVQP